MGEERRKILCLDFDGCLHSYTSGWKGAAVIPDPPVPGMWEFLAQAVEVFDVCVLSSRSGQEGGIVAMQQWFYKHAGEDPARLFVVNKLGFPTEKPPAFVGIDDRVLTFRGKWPSIKELENFRTWLQDDKVSEANPAEENPSASQEWVRRLIEEIGTAPQLMSPVAPVREGETVVATIDDEFLRKVFSLGMFWSKERDRNRLECNFSAEAEQKELLRAAWISNAKATIYFNIFWAFVREDLEMFDGQYVGLRQGWKIVRFEQERAVNIFDIFFGGQQPPH